jgi:hypothetical protein
VIQNIIGLIKTAIEVRLGKMSFDEYWELMRKSVWFNLAMVECKNNQSTLTNLSKLPRIIIRTEYPSQKFIIWKENRETIVKKMSQLTTLEDMNFAYASSNSRLYGRPYLEIYTPSKVVA